VATSSRTAFIVAAAAGLLAGLSVGTVLGAALSTWLTCARGCEFNVALFDAIGTWVGGVGVSLVAGAFAFLTVRRNTRRAQQIEQGIALMCTVRVRPLLRNGAATDKVAFEFTNRVEEPVYRPSISVLGAGKLAEDRVVASGRTWGTSTTYSHLGLTTPTTVHEARALVAREIRPMTMFEFHVRDRTYIRIGGDLRLANRSNRKALKKRAGKRA